MRSQARFSVSVIILIICALVDGVFVHAQTPAWVPTGSIVTSRSLHTATLLTNGKVLVVGGISVINPCCTTTDSAQLYDPGTGQWSASGSLATPRANHIAVRLASGKVLIASGNGSPFSSILASAEIYDPATGTFAAAGNLGIARQSPRATLLSDGRVLVTGGLVVVNGAAVFTNTAEVYDPTTNVWSPTTPMNAGRVLHSVTLLTNGKVLAAGGSEAAFNPLLQRTAEIYDPATNGWTLTGDLTTPRITHSTALLPGGKVLVTGGGTTGNSIIGGAELYDPATGQWTATGSMKSARVLHTLTLLSSGKVLAANGSSNEGLQKSTELYDPATGGWELTAEVNASRQNHTATLLRNGKVLAVGGSGGAGVGQLSSAELYDTGDAIFASVSAASFSSDGQLAPESIVAGFGANLATTIELAATVPLPTALGGASLRVRDSLGVERLASLFYASPTQINYVMPAGTASGAAFVTVTNGSTTVATGVVEVSSVAPGIFTANSSGHGLAAAQALRVRADGTQSFEPVARFDAGQGGFVAVPIDLGPATEEVFLVLYVTGLRLRSSQTDVNVTIGTTPGEVLYADVAPGYVGVDQINVRLSRALVGSGDVNVVVTVEGKAANTVRIRIQ